MFVYALLNMDDLTKHRKDRLRALIEGKPYAGNQAEFGRKAGLTKARITQLLNPDEPFGERAAESLCAKLELSPRWFEHGLATGEGEMVPTGGRVEPSNIVALPPSRRIVDTLDELQGRSVLHKWMDGQVSAAEAAATLEGLLQASAGLLPAAENRVA